MKYVFVDELQAKRHACVHFGDIRDAAKALRKLKVFAIEWSGHYKTRAMQCIGLEECPQSEFEGQVVVMTKGWKPSTGHTAERLGNVIFDVLSGFGDLMAFDTVITAEQEINFRGEFCNVDAADAALAGFRVFDLSVSFSTS